MKTKTPLNVGMIGYGFMGRAHSNAYRRGGKQLPEGAYIELHVTVDRDWQRKPHRIEHFGY